MHSQILFILNELTGLITNCLIKPIQQNKEANSR